MSIMSIMHPSISTKAKDLGLSLPAAFFLIAVHFLLFLFPSLLSFPSPPSPSLPTVSFKRPFQLKKKAAASIPAPVPPNLPPRQATPPTPTLTPTPTSTIFSTPHLHHQRRPSMSTASSSRPSTHEVSEEMGSKMTENTRQVVNTVKQFSIVQNYITPATQYVLQKYRQCPAVVRFSLLTFAALSAVPVACFTGFMAMVTLGCLIVAGIAFTIVEVRKSRCFFFWGGEGGFPLFSSSMGGEGCLFFDQFFFIFLDLFFRRTLRGNPNNFFFFLVVPTTREASPRLRPCSCCRPWRWSCC